MTSMGYPTKVAYRSLKSNRVIKQICDELNSLKTNNDLKWFEIDFRNINLCKTIVNSMRAGGWVLRWI